jgi:hypothetical protein
VRERREWATRTGIAVLLALMYVVLVLARRRRLEALTIHEIELQEGKEKERDSLANLF